MAQTSLKTEGPDLLDGWIDRTRRRKELRTRLAGEHLTALTKIGLRFAFYGRISTEDFQDKLSSARWQLEFAKELCCPAWTNRDRLLRPRLLTAPRLPWHLRPQAAALLAALADPDRGFDAIVVGEFERGFFGNQLIELAPLFQASGVQMWLPELDGPVDFDSEPHQTLLRLLGVHSKREVLRARYRVLAAMRAQVQIQGRLLGGRPPYGYCLVEVGPHPNKAHARWGRKLLRLEPDPATAPVVRRMFTQRLAGESIAAITRCLNERGVPCPSAADPERNPHRSGAEWTLGTVAAILANPRYTGWQVWNRQGTDHDPGDHADDLLGRAEVRRWNSLEQWALSSEVTHPALVTEENFVAVQAIHTAPTPIGDTTRRFMLSGLLMCQGCGRQLDAHWVHGRAAYRCRHGHRSARASGDALPKNIYIREDQLLIFITAHQPEATGQSHAADSQPLDRRVLTRYLETNDVMIVCGREALTLYVEGQLVREGQPPRIARVETPRRPRFRSRKLSTR